MSDKLEIGMRVMYWGPDPYRYQKIAIITAIDINNIGSRSLVTVKFEEDGWSADYFIYKLKPLTLTPEEQQYLADQQRRQAHANRYL